MVIKQSKIGIIGAGQLSLFLCQAASRLGFSTYVFASHNDDPALRHASSIYIGNIKDPQELENFSNNCDIVIYENEWLPTAQLAKTNAAEKFFPRPNTMTILSDKSLQKKLCIQANIPTSEMLVFDAQQKTAPDWLREVSEYFHEDGFVLKWAKGGYDGKGTFLIEKSQPHVDLHAMQSKALDFITAAVSQKTTVYAEKFVKFTQELALVAVKPRDGSLLSYPLVYTRQSSGICVRVWGPLLDDDLELQKIAHSYAQKMVENLPDLCGVFAIELFLTNERKLLVNELAPRVHNTGHVTLNTAIQSQFEAHVRATCNMGGINTSLKNPKQKFSMLNVLGPSEIPSGTLAVSPQLTHPNATLYWYEKKFTAPGRKMGHINIVASHETELLEIENQVEKDLFLWGSKA